MAIATLDATHGPMISRYCNEHSVASTFIPIEVENWINQSIFCQIKRRFESHREQLDLTALLKENWNTYDSEQPNALARTITSNVLSLLEDELLAPARLSPSADGGIALSFVENKNRAIIEVYNSGEIAAATYADIGDPVVWDVENTPDAIKATVHKIRLRLTQ